MKKPKAKVLIADPIAEDGVEVLRAHGLTPVLKHGPTAAQLKKLLCEVDAVIVRSATKIRASSLSRNTKLQVIGRAGIGVDNIEVDAMTAHGIAVLNTPDANATTTAELAIAHLFSLARKLTLADASVRAGKWEKTKFTGAEISGKTLAILGYGTIGRIVAARGRGLGLRIIVHDPFVATNVVVDDGYEPVALPQLLREADFVTIHAPGSVATMGLLGRAELCKMKKSSYLIQCARGGIVDEVALAAALKAGDIAGAAVDVFCEEPLPADHPYRQAPNIVFTPHLGASTVEAQRATGVTIAKQLVSYFHSGEAVNAVNLPRVPADLLVLAQPYMELARGLGKLLGAMELGGASTLELTLQGHVADVPESILVSELLAGLLGSSLSIPVNAVNASLLAERQGLEVSVKRKHDIEEFATLVHVTARHGRHTHQLAGTLLGGAQPRIALFEGIEVEAPLAGPVLVTMHRDRPGVIAELAGVLAVQRINITHMHVGSDPHSKKAVAFLRLDQLLSPAVVATIGKSKLIDSVIHLQL